MQIQPQKRVFNKTGRQEPIFLCQNSENNLENPPNNLSDKITKNKTELQSISKNIKSLNNLSDADITLENLDKINQKLGVTDNHDTDNNHLHFTQCNRRVRLFIDVPRGAKLTLQYTYDPQEFIRPCRTGRYNGGNVEWLNHEIGTITTDFADELFGNPTAVRLQVQTLPDDAEILVEVE